MTCVFSLLMVTAQELHGMYLFILPVVNGHSTRAGMYD